MMGLPFRIVMSWIFCGTVTGFADVDAAPSAIIGGGY